MSVVLMESSAILDVPLRSVHCQVSMVYKVGWRYLHSDSWDIILLVLLIHEININVSTGSLGLVLLLSVLSHIALDTGSDSKLGGSLTDLGKISTRESSSVLGEEVEVDTGSERRLSESSRKNRESGCLVGKRNVDELDVSWVDVMYG
jgi:hypothetical protein